MMKHSLKYPLILSHCFNQNSTVFQDTVCALFKQECIYRTRLQAHHRTRLVPCSFRAIRSVSRAPPLLRQLMPSFLTSVRSAMALAKHHIKESVLRKRGQDGKPIVHLFWGDTNPEREGTHQNRIHVP